MKKVFEIICMELPIDGMSCRVKGKFYYRISKSDASRDFANCYLAESDDINSPKVLLSDGIGEAVIDEDETFGIMVGGEFAYFGIEAEVEGLIKETPEGPIFEIVKSMKLNKDGESQEFKF